MTVGKRTNRRRPRRGVALIDAILGGVILGVGLSVVLSVTGRSMSMQADGERRMTAAWLADELLTMVLVDGPDVYPRRYDTSGAFGEPFEDYSYELDIQRVGPRLPYRVNAVVAWGNRPGDSVQVETLIAQRLGEEEQNREPLERVDRDARYYGEDEG